MSGTLDKGVSDTDSVFLPSRTTILQTQLRPFTPTPPRQTSESSVGLPLTWTQLWLGFRSNIFTELTTFYYISINTSGDSNTYVGRKKCVANQYGREVKPKHVISLSSSRIQQKHYLKEFRETVERMVADSKLPLSNILN